jgi:hypothetical protein
LQGRFESQNVMGGPNLSGTSPKDHLPVPDDHTIDGDSVVELLDQIPSIKVAHDPGGYSPGSATIYVFFIADDASEEELEFGWIPGNLCDLSKRYFATTFLSSSPTTSAKAVRSLPANRCGVPSHRSRPPSLDRHAVTRHQMTPSDRPPEWSRIPPARGPDQ